ncbi:hypothetical protein WJR50_17720 [Catalinimonas sp. 4WD22]|uniref:hypothetical protein n=1 Tax=Catalinimonas locisalis TaxID=3133978 RepID=UPI003100EC08
MRNYTLILLLLSILNFSCQEDKDLDPQEENSGELQPIANNGMMEATIDGEPFSTSLISSSVAIHNENPTIDVLTVAGIAIDAGDTTIVGIQLYGDYQTLETNTTYTSSATGIYPAVVGIYSPEPSAQQTAGFGSGELVITVLDKSALKISGTFQIAGEMINLGSPSNPVNSTFSIEGTFRDVTFEQIQSGQ